MNTNNLTSTKNTWFVLKVHSTAFNIWNVICPHLGAWSFQSGLVLFHIVAIQHQTLNNYAGVKDTRKKINKPSRMLNMPEWATVFCNFKKVSVQKVTSQETAEVQSMKISMKVLAVKKSK